MINRRYIPSAPLSAFVNCLWYLDQEPQTHAKERLLPNGESSIILDLLDGPIRIYNAQDVSRYSTYRSAIFSGARSNCFAIDSCERERVIGVQFRPGGAFPFFRPPASETENATVDLEDLWPRCAREIRERLLLAPSIDAMLHELERCLIEQLTRPIELHPAVQYALDRFAHSKHVCRVGSVIDEIGMSSRRFIKLFHQQVGLAPKVFCRVRRFQHVIEAVHCKEDVDWADIALECGYYDQAHFIHDFESFSGLTPSAYLSAVTPHLNHVPLT